MGIEELFEIEEIDDRVGWVEDEKEDEEEDEIDDGWSLEIEREESGGFKLPLEEEEEIEIGGLDNDEEGTGREGEVVEGIEGE